MKNTEAAFHWIISILEKNHVQYKITGGFAARVYGVDRELADIDIDIANADIAKIADEVQSFIVVGPARYKDNEWDLEFMTLRYQGQDIDIAGVEGSFWNKQAQTWESFPHNLDAVEMKQVFGRTVPIESRKTLMDYKQKLGREVDLEDVRRLQHL